MKIKMRDVVESFGAMSALMTGYSFDLRLSYDLGKVFKSVKAEATNYDELVATLNERMGTKKENGDMIIPPEQMTEYRAEIKKLQDAEVDVWGKEPFTLEVIKQGMIVAHKQAKPEDKDFIPTLPPAILSPLDWLIVPAEEAKAAGA